MREYSIKIINFSNVGKLLIEICGLSCNQSWDKFLLIGSVYTGCTNTKHSFTFHFSFVKRTSFTKVNYWKIP